MLPSYVLNNLFSFRMERSKWEIKINNTMIRKLSFYSYYYFIIKGNTLYIDTVSGSSERCSLKILDRLCRPLYIQDYSLKSNIFSNLSYL